MSQSRYGKYFVTELRNSTTLPSFRQNVSGQTQACHIRREPVLRLDDEVVPGCFYSEYVWHFPPAGQPVPTEDGPKPHTHPFDEVISFVGTNPADLFDLGGEVELWLEDQRFLLARSFVVYVPAGMRHCPITIRRIERPIFQYVLGSGPKYEGQEASGPALSAPRDLGSNFVLEYKKNLVHPEYRAKSKDEPGRHVHIAYLDAEVVENANFYVEASWFGTAPRPAALPGQEPSGPEPHEHPFPELITFFGTNPDDVHDLGGEAELWIDGEQHILTQSFVAFIPGGVVHCPLVLRNVRMPIFHFTAGPGRMYV